NYPAVKINKVRQYAYATAVTRLYAIFENFIEKTLSSYLDFLAENKLYGELSSGIKNEYRIGFSHVLSRIEQPRFKSLTHEGLIDKYHKAINNIIGYQFVSEALIRHDNNLRLSVIFELFSRLGLKSLDNWLVLSAKDSDLYEDKEKSREQIESELSIFIELRNDSSHGVPEQIGSQSTIERHCELIRFLIVAITSYLESEILELLILGGKATKIGKISEVLTRANASILNINSRGLVSLECEYFFKESNDFYTQKINSIQIDDVPVTTFSIINDNSEVGIVCNRLPKKNAEVYMVI
ncbi:TPA: MAE_28990/MAE_18760 family HEPN-like nuclease, partial [Serratia fonticola]